MPTDQFDFECGDCAALAVALHRSTGLPLSAVVDFDEVLKQDVLVHAYIRIANAAYPIFDIRGPGDLDYVLDRFPNSGYTREIFIHESELLSMAYTPANLPDIERVMPFARVLLEEWPDEFVGTVKSQ